MKRLLRIILLSTVALASFCSIAFALLFQRDIPVEVLKSQYAAAPSQFVEVQGMPVHLRIEGADIPKAGDTNSTNPTNPAKSTKPTIVLLHGTGASLHTWDGWTLELKKTHRVIRMDLPGFGLTGPHPQARYGVDDYVEFVQATLRAIGLDAATPVTFAGSSLGGQIAWHYALKYPKEVSRLVLIAAAGYPRDANVDLPIVLRLARIDWLAPLLTRTASRELVELSLRDVYAYRARVGKRLVARYYELSLRTGNRQAFIDRANQMAPDNPANIKKITVPTLILWGAKDKWIPVEDATRFNKDIAGSVLKVYPDLGHVPMEENPEETVKILQRWLPKGR
jgi:pimeloyl-ACP methyl ester carboxylesterase